jgi:hypothetical protein
MFLGRKIKDKINGYCFYFAEFMFTIKTDTLVFTAIASNLKKYVFKKK